MVDGNDEEERLLEESKTTGKQTNYSRIITGVVVLVLVDILWVASAELSDFIFHNEGFDKPFFTTYVKTSAFVLYLPAVWCRSQWRRYFKGGTKNQLVKGTSSKTQLQHHNSGESSDHGMTYHELPQYLNNEASDSVAIEKLPLVKLMKLALIFCILWFLATLSYQEALAFTSPAAVNILSSSSGLFTLILAAVFQSSNTDRFSYSKLIAVFMSISGIVLVTLSDSQQSKGSINYGALFSLAGAILYSCYLVLLKRKVPHEEQMDIATFFGFVGLFNILLLCPGFWLLHETNIEIFELPKDWKTWASILLNAVFGTALSEYLWLWGCYLTSSLSATLALGMVMPLTMLTDIIRGRVDLSLMFVLGSVPIFVSFFIITYLCHYENWDPVKTWVLSAFRWCSTPRHRTTYVK